MPKGYRIKLKNGTVGSDGSYPDQALMAEAEAINCLPTYIGEGGEIYEVTGRYVGCRTCTNLPNAEKIGCYKEGVTTDNCLRTRTKEG